MKFLDEWIAADESGCDPHHGVDIGISKEFLPLRDIRRIVSK